MSADPEIDDRDPLYDRPNYALAPLDRVRDLVTGLRYIIAYVPTRDVVYAIREGEPLAIGDLVRLDGRLIAKVGAVLPAPPVSTPQPGVEADDNARPGVARDVVRLCRPGHHRGAV